MAEHERLIAPSTALGERGVGVRFDVEHEGRRKPAFAVRVDGVVRAYVNECAHQQQELDWTPGEFFDDAREFLACTAHGALYEPATGRCAGGPCRGKGLASLHVVERDGSVWLIE